MRIAREGISKPKSGFDMIQSYTSARISIINMILFIIEYDKCRESKFAMIYDATASFHLYYKLFVKY